MEVTPFCAFPAQAGIQTLTNRLVIPRQSSPFDRLRMRMKGGGVLYPRHCERSEATQGTDTGLR